MRASRMVACVASICLLTIVTKTPTVLSAKSVADPLSRDRRITQLARLAPVDSCRSSDATPTNGMDLSQTRTASLGFPRPTTFGSPASLNIAVLPLTFSDLPYRDSDHTALQAAMREFKRYFEAMSYGKAAITYQVVALADAVRMPDTARSYGAFGEYIDLGRVVQESLNNASPTLKLSSYDMVALEIARNDSVKFWQSRIRIPLRLRMDEWVAQFWRVDGKGPTGEPSRTRSVTSGSRWRTSMTIRHHRNMTARSGSTT